MKDYTDALATKMLATHCIACGKALVDARSVSLGIGPCCRKGIKGDIDETTRTTANKYIFDASIAAQEGFVERVMECVDLIDSLGFTKLALKVRKRFKRFNEIHEHHGKADIIIEIKGEMLCVKTPYRRGRSNEFIKAWRKIPGRRFRDGHNYIPHAQKAALWTLLREYFPGKSGIGPRGVFRVPKPELEMKQSELGL